MTRTRAALDRDRIVAAAVAIAEEDGLEGLSMRRVARRLDTAPMSLYRHVGGKDEVVGLVVQELASRLPPGEPARPWPEVLKDIFTAVRRLLCDHPGLVGHLSDEATVSPATLRSTESALDALRRAGLDDRGAAHAFTTLWTFTVGSVLVEQSLFGARADDAADERRERVMQAVGAAALEGLPRVAAATPHWLAADGAALFEAGLDLLLAGVRADARQHESAGAQTSSQLATTSSDE